MREADGNLADFTSQLKNPQISDEIILNLVQDYTADKFDPEGKVILPKFAEIQDIIFRTDLVNQIRPSVIDQFRRKLVGQQVSINSGKIL